MVADIPLFSRIQRLARSGSPGRAWEMLADSGLLSDHKNVRALTLKGRLLKDRARRGSAEERSALFDQAADAYLAAHQAEHGSYPLINAATLKLLAGEADASRQIAEAVLQLLDDTPDEAETIYWLGATRAEAFLLLGNPHRARQALTDAVAAAPFAWEDHAATVGQLELLADALATPLDWLDNLRPPRSLHFSGILGLAAANETLEHEIAVWLEAETVGFGFGALAAGADIVVAEALAARDAEIHVVLPCDVPTFRLRSVVAVDEAWGPRFDALIEQAASVDILNSAQAPTPEAVRIAEEVAAGQAIQLARTLRSEALELRIADGVEPAADKDKQPPSRMRRQVLSAQRVAPRSVAAVEPSEDARATVAVAAQKSSNVTSVAFEQLAEAWDHARNSAGAGGMVAIHYGVSPQDTQRTQMLLPASAPGHIIGSEAAAFALLSQRADIDVQPMGELRSAFGTEPIHALAALSQDHVLEHSRSK